MAVKKLSSVPAGTVIKIPETTGNVDYVVLHQNYNSTQNGNGRTLITRSQPFTFNDDDTRGQYGAWTTTWGYNWCNTTYPANIDSSFINNIPTTTYCAQTKLDEKTPQLGLVQSKFFFLGAQEMNLYNLDANNIVIETCQSTTAVSGYAYFRSFLDNTYSPSSGVTYSRHPILLRSGFSYYDSDSYAYRTSATTFAEYLKQTGINGYTATYSLDWRYQGTGYLFPCFTLPGNEWQVNDDGTLYQGPLPPAGFINFPQLAMQTQPMNLQWQESDGATSYIVQRKSSADTDWVTIYTGANASTSETVGAWTSVQYRVSASNADGSSPYTESPTLNIVPASQLVISGQDGELGTLVNDVPYTVLSDTGNPITLVRTINETNVYSGTVESGFSYTIPIGELPTGNNTIVITATVNTTAGTPYTLTRTWQYIKSPMVFNTSGSIAQLTENQKNIWPITLQEAVNTYSFWGGSLDKAMLRLANSTFYYSTQTAKYTEYTVNMSKVQVGDTVQLPENGIMQDFIVCSLNYEPTLNTSGTRVLLIRKRELYGIGPVWGENKIWTTSNIYSFYNGEYLNYFPEDIKTSIGTTSYLAGTNASGTVGTVSSAVFALSMAELGQYEVTYGTYKTGEGTALSNDVLDIIWNSVVYKQYDIAQMNLRSYDSGLWYRAQNGFLGDFTRTYGGRNFDDNGYYCFHPCFTLPTTFNKTFYVDITGAVHPEQEYYAGGSLVSIDGANVPVVKWTEGSYTGTGTYGSGNPCSLSFESRPLYVFIFQQNNQYRAEIDCYALTNSFQNYGYTVYDDSSLRSSGCYASADGATVSWYYYNGITHQMNLSDQTYNYFAILA